MVQPLVLPRILDRQHIGHLFDDADRRVVAFVVGADRAYILVGEVVAVHAIFDLVAEAVDTLRHFGYGFAFHPQDVDSQAQRRTAPYAREFRQLADNVL